MLVDENHTVSELELIDCWNSKFVQTLNCYETFFETKELIM